MTQTSIARELGISASAVTKLKKKGMPVTSADAARDWRRSHVPAKRLRRDPGPSPETTLERVRLLSGLAEHAAQIWRFDLVRAALRLAMRDVPPDRRREVFMSERVWIELLGSRSPYVLQWHTANGLVTSFADGLSGRVAYRLACGEIGAEVESILARAEMTQKQG